MIGKQLQNIQEYISDRRIIIVTSDHLLLELLETAKRTKLTRYFPPDKVDDLSVFLKAVGEHYTVKSSHHFEQDPKDSFLLDLIEKSKADYLITGDKALLELKSFKTAVIIKASDFEKEMRIAE